MKHTHEPIILITGANGEVGRGLVAHYAALPDALPIVTLDLHPLVDDLAPFVTRHFTASILDKDTLAEIAESYRIDTIFHLAALLSTAGEKNPARAHDVNVNGTLNMLELAATVGQQQGQAVKVIYPSSIAVYGLPDVATKIAMGAVCEDDYLRPTTMYGVNKLCGEHLGRYYAQHYGQLADGQQTSNVDFRGVRFPGLISADTVPSGGTSDYGPEMIHAAARGDAYICFVREDTTLPFMTMPDAVRALTLLAGAARDSLSRHVYNVTSFSLRADDFATLVQREFPDARITFMPDKGRQGIVDTWAAALNDQDARRDWGWLPVHDCEAAFEAYVFPRIHARYAVGELTS